MALAWQADVTRVSTLMVSRELSGMTYPQIGISDPHHAYLQAEEPGSEKKTETQNGKAHVCRAIKVTPSAALRIIQVLISSSRCRSSTNHAFADRERGQATRCLNPPPAPHRSNITPRATSVRSYPSPVRSNRIGEYAFEQQGPEEPCTENQVIWATRIRWISASIDFRAWHPVEALRLTSIIRETRGAGNNHGFLSCCGEIAA
jgi:Protein of unknown function (DUF1552)